MGRRGLEVSVSANASVTISIQGTVAFVVLLHLYKKPAPYQRNHLGFYIANGQGLSSNCHGLLGRWLIPMPVTVRFPKVNLMLSTP